MLLIAFGCAMLIYVVLAFALAILASQMMALLQGDEEGARLERQAAPTLRWYGVQSMMGYHPLNPRLWFDIVRASNLPERARNKQWQIRFVFVALIVAIVVLLAFVFVRT